MSPREEPKERQFRVFNLLPSDRKLLKEIRNIEGLTNRHDALGKLTTIVEAMPTEKIEQRKSIRLGIPDDLHYAIDSLKKTTGKTYVSILVEAAREYKRLHSE